MIFTQRRTLCQPSRARDAAGLRARQAVRIRFCSSSTAPYRNYNRDPFPPAEYKIPLGKAAVATPGTDVTLVTYGATVQRSMQAARELEKSQGLSVEVIDLRSLWPWDQEAVAESVAKTSRLLVVHEDILEFGMGAEISAWLTSLLWISMRPDEGRGETSWVLRTDVEDEISSHDNRRRLHRRGLDAVGRSP